MPDWTLIHEPDGRLLIAHGSYDPKGRKQICQRHYNGCKRNATFFSATAERTLPNLFLCGQHMGAQKRSWKTEGVSWKVVSPGDPVLAAFEKANATRDQELHLDMVRRLGYAP